MRSFLSLALVSLSMAASTLEGADSVPFKEGVYTDKFHKNIFKFRGGQFQRWSNVGPPLKPMGTGTFTVAGKEIALKYETDEKDKWTFRMFRGKPSLWDVGSNAYWQNMGKVANFGVLYWTKSSPEQIVRDHPNIHE